MKFEEQIKEDLHRFLAGVKRIDEKLPECPDLEEIYPVIEETYLPDGVREFRDYPLVSLGWMMFIGMAMAKFWDEDWVKYSEEGGVKICRSLIDARGYDNLDDYILEMVLGLEEMEREELSAVVGECAARILSAIQHSGIEPGTPEAVKAYLASIHLLYSMGVAMELNALGYHMTLMG